MSEKQTKEVATSAPLNLTQDGLQALISAAVTAAVAEAKKPAPPTDKELRDIQQAQEARAALAADVVDTIKQKQFNQRTCTHSHGTGESHGVYVQDGNYILCQFCQAKVRPEVPVEQRTDKSAIYDTALFNRLFQEMRKTDM